MSMKDKFIQQCNANNNHYFIQVFNDDGTSFVLHLHEESSLHDLYKNVNLYKKEDMFSCNSLLTYNGEVLPNYGTMSLKEALSNKDDSREFRLNYNNKKDVQFNDLSPKKPNNGQWVWRPDGGFVCGR